MQDLAAVGAGREDRVISALAGVAERRALLGMAEDLPDERIDVHDQSLIARAGTGLPRAREAVGEHPVELAHMPERERAQERPERRRRRHAVPEDRGRAAAAQHVAVIDAVRSQRHRRDRAS